MAMKKRDSLTELNEVETTTLSSESEPTPDDILDKIGGKNFQIWKIFVMASFTWAFTGPFIMTGAFIDDDRCDYSSTSASNLSADCLHRKSGSMINEFELHGPNEHLKHWFTSTFMLGNIVGGSAISLLADQYGRKPSVVICTLLLGITGCFMQLVKTYQFVLILRFLHGIFFTGSSIAIWVLGYESIPTNLRSYATFTYGTTWVIGYCAIAPIAHFIPNWRHFLTFLSVPCIIYSMFLWIFLPESFHFLVGKNRHREAKEWVNKCKVEKLTFSLDDSRICRPMKSHEGESFYTQIKELIKNKKLIFRTIVFSFLWTTDVLVYFGMSLFSVKLVGNHYFNYVAIGLIEIPAYAFGPILLDKIGRRLTISTTHIATAIAFTMAAFILTENAMAQLFFWLVAKFAISAAFMGIFVYAAESFPTTERSVCVGTCSVFGKLFGCLAPFIQTTASIWGPFPLVIFGAISGVAGFVTLLLPETKDQQLPDSSDSMA